MYLGRQTVQTILVSEAYTRVKLRNSFTVQYSTYGVLRFGKILYFVHINEKTCYVENTGAS